MGEISRKMAVLRTMASQKNDESALNDETDVHPAIDQALEVLGHSRTGSHDMPQDLPSRGSAGHAAGTCKPCAAMMALITITSNGEPTCQRGRDCELCHFPHKGQKRPGKVRRSQLRKAALQMSTEEAERLQDATEKTKGYESRGLAYMNHLVRKRTNDSIGLENVSQGVSSTGAQGPHVAELAPAQTTKLQL